MLSLLIKLLIKSPDDIKNPKIRNRYGILCSVTGICLNIILFIMKFTIGTLSGSIAITADAFNNLSDSGSSLITLLGFFMSGKKPDPDHPFGHGRIEYISGLIVSLFILVMGYELIKSSVTKIIHPEPVQTSIAVFIILIGSILVKLYMSYYNKKIGNKISSSAMKATATDSVSDCIATSVVLLCTILSIIFPIQIDGYCGIAVGLFISYAGLCAAKDTISPLLGQSADPDLVHSIENVVLSDPSILGIHDLIVHDYGPGRLMITLHAEVPYDGDILLLHDCIDNVEKELMEQLHCSATIHMDPIMYNDEQMLTLKKYVTEVLYSIDPILAMHDFRTVTGPSHTNLIFDIVTPYQYKINDEDLSKMIQSQIKAQHTDYYCVINIDKDYCRQVN